MSWRLTGRVRQAMLARQSLSSNLSWTAAAVVLPTALRLAIDGEHTGFPFVTYFPAIVLAALFLGWRYGAIVALLSAVAARLLFMGGEPPLTEAPEALAILALFVLSCVLLIVIGDTLRRTLMELEALSSREELLNAELRHRMKNMLAVVSSLASLTHRHADPERAHIAFSERLAALDRATSLLGGDSAVACALPDLAEQALRPFLSDYDIRLIGDPQQVHRDCCVPAVLALHELATNAIKYGSLSVPQGWVQLEWGEHSAGMLTMRWCEQGGPPVRKPERRGLGSRILSMRSAATSFQIDFAPDGIRCEMRLKAT